MLAETLKRYSANDFSKDLIAGLTVGIVALPLAMALAIASGVKPEAGIFTAVIVGFIISALGGTRVCIGGLTGAFIVIVAARAELRRDLSCAGSSSLSQARPFAP